MDLAVDNIILRSFVGKYFSQSVLMKGDDLGESGKFEPALGSLKEFSEFVQKLPENDEPELLGLPSNIDGLHQRSEGERILRDLRVIQSVDQENAEGRSGDWMERIGRMRREVLKVKQVKTTFCHSGQF